MAIQEGRNMDKKNAICIDHAGSACLLGCSFYLKINLQVLFRRKMKAGCLLPMKCRKPLPLHEALPCYWRSWTAYQDIPEVKVVGGLAGLNIISFSNKSNAGTMFVMLKPWDDRKGKEHHVQSVIAKISAATADIKEARVLPIAPPAIPGLGAHPVLHLSCSKQPVQTIFSNLKK